MEIYRVKESDLIGSIKDFPIEVVQKMIERQYEQTGKCDIKVFQRYLECGSDKSSGGFDWKPTKEGYGFWNYVIGHRSFDVFFFNGYPKQTQEQEEDYWIKPEGVRMLVWDDDEEDAIESIVIVKLPKKSTPVRFRYFCVHHAFEEQFKKGEEFHIVNFKNAKPIPQIKEITMQEIADKFGLKVDEFKIV